MPSTNTVQIDSHAVATLHYIRTSMEGAASVAVPGSAGYAMGTIGLLAMVLSLSEGLREHWLIIWLLAAVMSASVGGALLVRPSSLQGLALTATPIRRFALCLCPSLFGGAIMTAVLWESGNLHAIPGTWLLFYGCALIAASVPTTSAVAVMGGLFVGLGMLAFLLSDAMQMFMLGAGFGGVHLLFGFLIGRANHGREA
jgi:hypothetical protein